MDSHSIGKTIAELRKQKGWTQAELAEKLHVSDKAVSKWENDGGTPGIENFPALAQLFDVTTDYLISGKVQEKEIEVISRAELCARSDNVSMLKEINVDHKDEKGKTLKDYIVQYNSQKVFIAFCETYKGAISKFDIDYAIKCCIVYNRLDLLVGVLRKPNNMGTSSPSDDVRDILELMVKDDESNFRTPVEKSFCVLTEDTIKTIVCDERINRNTLSVLLGTQKDRQCVWYRVFPFLIHQAYINEKEEMLNNLLVLTEKNNKTGFELISNNGNANNATNNYYYLFNNNSRKGFGFVRILMDTIMAALNKGDFERAERFNEINKFLNSHYNFKANVASDDDIRIAHVRHDKTLSKEEIIIQSSIRSNVLNIEAIMETENMDIAKKAISAYPIHIVEYLQKLYNMRQRKLLFEWAVDNGNDGLANAILASDDNRIKYNILTYVSDSQNINSKYIKLDDLRMIINNPGAWEKTEQKIKDFRWKILAEIEKKAEGSSVRSEYTQGYFVTELKKGNTEIVVIKLCVRMEANLRILGYEGTFEEMLTNYCNTAACNSDTARILHKLRMYRNSLVHADKSTEVMTMSEINACIEYICNMI